MSKFIFTFFLQLEEECRGFTNGGNIVSNDLIRLNKVTKKLLRLVPQVCDNPPSMFYYIFF